VAPPAGPPGRVKLLLDTHHSRLAAERLRRDGHDVEAAADDQMLASIPDEELLRAATRAGRALVTENARDFDRIIRTWAMTGEHHAGVVFTSPRRYHRGSRAYPANLVTALKKLLDDARPLEQDRVLWLP
jgi:hypothetical protein